MAGKGTTPKFTQLFAEKTRIHDTWLGDPGLVASAFKYLGENVFQFYIWDTYFSFMSPLVRKGKNMKKYLENNLGKKEVGA